MSDRFSNSESHAGKKHIRTVRLCSRCGKPQGKQGVSSLTSWLFQETFCQCQLRESSGDLAAKKVASEGSLFGDGPEDKDVFDLPHLGDEYEVLERIGKGGMGSVYKVRDVNLDRLLAIKILHDDLKSDSQAVSRFEREAKAALVLMHANLVPVYSYGCSALGAPYLVMDFVDGISLERKLKNESYLEVLYAIDIFLQVCEALSHAHGHGIIHRDIKPGNIIITSDKEGKPIAKLVDFGIAKVRSSSSRETQNLTQTGEVFGSPHYMSPEQCLGFELDSRSDIYSLGCVMYECISGKSPFEGHNAVQLIAKHLSSEVVPPRVIDSSADEKLSHHLIEIILKCLQKEPSDRYFSAELLATDLKHVTEQVSQKSLLRLTRKLSILRTIFVVLTVVSVLGIGLSFQSIPIRASLFLPMLTAAIGATLIIQTNREFVSRSQFQSKIIRESAGACSTLLMLCQSLLAICFTLAFFTYLTPLFASSYAVVAGCVSAIIALVGWTGFLQNIESTDIKGSIFTAKITHVISASLITLLTAFVWQSIDRTHQPYEVSSSKSSQEYSFGETPNASEARMISKAFPTPETETIPVSVFESPTDSPFSEIREQDGRSIRVFTFPAHLVIGNIYSLSDNRRAEFKAQGKVSFPAEDRIGLRLTTEACDRNASLLRKFRPDDISALLLGASPVKTGTVGVDECAYYIRTWTNLTGLYARDSDFSDKGLAYCHNFPQLVSLDVDSTEVSSKGLMQFPRLRQLSYLSAGGIANGAEIISALKQSSNIRRLSMMHSDITDRDLRTVSRFPNLEELRLDYCKKITDQGIKYLVENTKLKSLHIQGTAVTPNAIPDLLKFRAMERMSIPSWPVTDVERLQRNAPRRSLVTPML